MKKYIVYLFTGIYSLLCCTSCAQYETSKMLNLDVSAFKEKMKEDNVIILDVRTPDETRLGKIEGAIEIDVKSGKFENKIQILNPSNTYLVYCRSGRRSIKACSIMESNGFEKLYNLEGGYNIWKKFE